MLTNALFIPVQNYQLMVLDTDRCSLFDKLLISHWELGLW